MRLFTWLSLFLYLSLTIIPSLSQAEDASPFTSTEALPAAFQGRFRPLEAVAKSWLYQFYHKNTLNDEEALLFGVSSKSSLDLLWKIHFLGHVPFDQAPFFWIHLAHIKELLQLPNMQDRFSYDNLNQAIYHFKDTQIALLRPLLLNEYMKAYFSPANRTQREKIELKQLFPGLIVQLERDALIISDTSKQSQWTYLNPKVVIDKAGKQAVLSSTAPNKNLIEEILQLLQNMQVYASYLRPDDLIDKQAHVQTMKDSLLVSLREAGSTLKMLPLKHLSGEWVSLHAFKLEAYDQKKHPSIGNFTCFSDHAFEHLKSAYLELEDAVLTLPNDFKTIEDKAKNFSNNYQKAYEEIADKPYKQAANKQLSYPSFTMLKLEQIYYHVPLIEITILLYFVALLFAIWARNQSNSMHLGKGSLALLILAFCAHTTILALRCYILQRPPVSNMFETLVYVPWIGMVIGFIFYLKGNFYQILLIATFISIALLILLKITQVDAHLENVQAVLDSQYWLIIHVLMIVGSYGAFIVSGMLGHAFLGAFVYYKKENEWLHHMAKGILYTLYVGVGLLIPGTLLGGVWAAESWGRFWDWDPKESWAFISACVYILIIHAYTFKYIRSFGLAIGSVAGLMAISFTWYGVNYILGTGLHSYGFGHGGEGYYFAYLVGEIIFIIGISGYRQILIRNTS